tara:strand:+ start:987 stop:1346 length:360 start_codon:yes stop_codon:yes gene_type:complete
MRFLHTKTFRVATTFAVIATVCASIVVLPTVWAKKKSSVSKNKVESAKIYVRGFEEGRNGTIAAVNANMCGTAYQRKGLEPGPECYQFIEDFKLYEARYEAAKKIIEDSKQDGKNKKRN